MQEVLHSILFIDDSVHMSEEKHLDEYVLNESGLIYAGTYHHMFTWPWNFAQVKVAMQWSLSMCKFIEFVPYQLYFINFILYFSLILSLWMQCSISWICPSYSIQTDDVIQQSLPGR